MGHMGGRGLWHSVSWPKLRVVATGELPPRLAQVCHHSMRQNSVSGCRMLGNTYRATAARAKNTIGFHIPNMFCGDQRQMVSASLSKPFPKPETPAYWCWRRLGTVMVGSLLPPG